MYCSTACICCLHRGLSLQTTAQASPTRFAQHARRGEGTHIGKCYLWRMGVLERRPMMRCDVLCCMVCAACTWASCKKPEVLTGRDGDPGRRVGLYVWMCSSTHDVRP